jgi:hypothetical protein
MTIGDFLNDLTRRGDLIPLVAICGGLVIAVVAIVCAAIRAVTVGRAREETKRELAAYVADGTIEAGTAIEIIESGRTAGARAPVASVGIGGCGVRVGGAKSPRVGSA